jgi:hypothetical protein
MSIYLECDVGLSCREKYTIEFTNMNSQISQLVMKTEPDKLQVRLKKGYYNKFDFYDDADWIETWLNVTRIQFFPCSFMSDEYSMRLFLMNEKTGMIPFLQIRIKKRDIEQSAYMHAHKKYLDYDRWQSEFNWHVRKEGFEFICEPEPVKKLDSHLQPVKVAEEAGVEEQSSESMTIESLLGIKKKDWNYYDVLGITASSTLKEIRNAYKKSAMEWHPDKNKNSKQPENIMTYVFQLIVEAYETLSNPTTREDYDRIFSHNHEKWNLKNMNPYIIVY